MFGLTIRSKLSIEIDVKMERIKVLGEMSDFCCKLSENYSSVGIGKHNVHHALMAVCKEACRKMDHVNFR